MRAWVLGLVGAAALVAAPVFAHDHGSRGRVSVGIGFGYGFGYGYPYYRPFPYYYPYFGVGIYPAYSRPRRAKDDGGGEVRTKKLYVYPKAGQSEAQTAEDRYQCHVWATDASDFDPTLGAGTAAQAEDYQRAFTACMEGRDYVVK